MYLSLTSRVDYRVADSLEWYSYNNMLASSSAWSSEAYHKLHQLCGTTTTAVVVVLFRSNLFDYIGATSVVCCKDYPVGWVVTDRSFTPTLL